jgi:hypothetical protein
MASFPEGSAEAVFRMSPKRPPTLGFLRVGLDAPLVPSTVGVFLDLKPSTVSGPALSAEGSASQH